MSLSKNIRFSSQGRLKTAQSGMTLIEVLIAMFVLAIGVLALLAVQLRTVSGVRDAEGQTIVSQITQNLIEGMLVNPTLTVATDASGQTTSQFNKAYTIYHTSGEVAEASSAMPSAAATLTQAELATAQLNQFRNDLVAALPDRDIYFAVCQDNSGRDPSFASNTNTANFNCNNTGDTVVKVLWLKENEEDADAEPIVYTYQSRVGD